MPEPKITAQGMRVLNAFISAGVSKELSGADIAEGSGMLSGTLYPILVRYRNAGWLDDRWEKEEPEKLGRPQRRYYRITGAGQRAYQRGTEKAATGAFVWA